jgi:hypothetical protein
MKMTEDEQQRATKREEAGGEVKSNEIRVLYVLSIDTR